MITYAILGYGRMGSRHGRVISSHENSCVSAVIDIDHEKIGNCGFKGYHDLDSFLATDTDSEIVIISTPNGLHLDHAKKCLDAGKHIFVEKPLTLHIKEIDVLLNKAINNGRKIFSGWQVQYSPPVVFLLDKIKKGELGKILSVQADCFWSRGSKYYSDGWHGSRRLDGGPLYTQFTHIIHLFFKMFQDLKVESVNFSKLRPEIKTEFEDTGNISFKSADIPVRLNYSTASPEGTQINTLTFISEKAVVKLEGPYFNHMSINSNLQINLENLVYEDIAHYCLSKQLVHIEKKLSQDGFYLEPLTRKVISCVEQVYSLRPSF